VRPFRMACRHQIFVYEIHERPEKPIAVSWLRGWQGRTVLLALLFIRLPRWKIWNYPGICMPAGAIGSCSAFGRAQTGPFRRKTSIKKPQNLNDPILK
jgi:hypothetical protein